MEIIVPKGLAIGFLWGQSPASRSSATFVAKLTLKLQHDRVAEILPECDELSGDVPFEDPALGLRYPSDFALFKPRAELMVVGHVYAPNKRPVTNLDATIRLGTWNKTLSVLGDRKLESWVITKRPSGEPNPFTSMPITYARSLGGPKNKFNPHGCGLEDDRAPNFELPSGAPADPSPRGFGPISDQCELRQKCVGTYGPDYVAKYWPGLPGDFDYSYFNAAPLDQQFDTFFKGSEVLEFIHLHPTVPHFRTQLPRRRVRLFANVRATTGELVWREIELNLDTIWVDTDTEKATLIWRGVTAARTPKLVEFRDLFAAVESVREEGRTAEEYRRDFLAILERRKREFDSPEDDKEEDKAFEAAMAELAKESAAVDAEIAVGEAAAMSAFSESIGVWNPNGFQIEPLFASSPTPLNFAEMRAEISAQIEQLRIADPGQVEHLEQVLGELNEVEQLNLEAEQLEQSGSLGDEPIATRGSVIEAAQGSGDLRNRDLSKLDLTGLDLSGCDFTGSDLNEAILIETNLSKAILRDVDLQRADLTNADLRGAILDDADLAKANLTGAKLTEMSISQTNFSRLNLAAADFSGCTGLGADFSKANLTEARFANVDLPQANFCLTKIERANFVGAKLVAARFVGAKAKEINLQGADITNLHGSEGADFRGAILTKVKGNGAIWEESLLDGALCSRSEWVGAQFSFASLIEAQLDRSNLTGAVFDDAIVRGAVLCESNMLRCSLDRADFSNADLQATNLYGSGMWNTNFHRANLKRANVKGTALAQPGNP